MPPPAKTRVASRSGGCLIHPLTGNAPSAGRFRLGFRLLAALATDSFYKGNRCVLGGEEMPSLRVGLFVTCLVDFFRPTVGFAAAKLLEDAGCTVEVPAQTCCGQPAFNSGDRADARA